MFSLQDYEENPVHPTVANLEELNLKLDPCDRFMLARLIPFMKKSPRLQKLVLKVCIVCVILFLFKKFGFDNIGFEGISLTKATIMFMLNMYFAFNNNNKKSNTRGLFTLCLHLLIKESPAHSRF